MKHLSTMKHLRIIASVIGVPILLVLSACGGGGGGGGGGGDGSGGAGPTPVLSLFAGNMGGPGNTDGTGSAARFNFSQGIATDSAGNVYVADTENSTVRKITPAGVVTTLAGTAGTPGSTDSADGTASFNQPAGVAADIAGNVYVADTSNGTIRKITPAGVVTTLAGTAGMQGSTDSADGPPSFRFPQGVAADSAGNVYVADTENHTIRKITPAGVVTTFAGTAGTPGSTDSAGGIPSFNFPRGVATDSAGNVYVADTFNHTIRKITPAGVVTTLAGAAGTLGSTDSAAGSPRFTFPEGVTTDGASNVYVADTSNSTIRKITPAGVVTTLAGTAGTQGSTDSADGPPSFRFPQGVAADSAGNVYVADIRNTTVRKITPAGEVSTLAGTVRVTGSIDDTGAAARFDFPQGVAADSAGNVYVADAGNSTIRKITPAGIVTTLAGTAGTPGSTDSADGPPSFMFPSGVATDSAGNVYVADLRNHTIRKITPAGIVTTLAGTAGDFGSADGTGAMARLNRPFGVATDGAGNVYVADTDNSTIRKITPAGVVTTLAGTAGEGGSVDGTESAARFQSPFGVATDSAGNVYVADTNNSAIRKITPAGVVTTLAGTAGDFGSADGTGNMARFRRPFGVATDSAGNVYVADTDNSTVRKITPAGVVTTIVGVAEQELFVGQESFVPGALPGRLARPQGVAVSGTSLYITLYNGVAVVQNRP